MSEGRKTDNHVMLVWLETVQNIIGPLGLKSVLNYAHLQKYIENFPPNNDNLEIPLEDLQNLYSSLFELFGKKGARGLQIRVGREAARLAIEMRPQISKPVKLAARLLSEPRKMRLTLEKHIEQIEQRFDYSSNLPPIELREDEDCFMYVDEAWFESEGRTSETPVCGLLIGMLTYLIEWITGNQHQVEEIQCRAMGHSADVFRIEKSLKEKS
jgi:predicted hydrocarbon binding protein